MALLCDAKPLFLIGGCLSPILLLPCACDRRSKDVSNLDPRVLGRIDKCWFAHKIKGELSVLPKHLHSEMIPSTHHDPEEVDLRLQRLRFIAKHIDFVVHLAPVPKHPLFAGVLPV